MPCKQACTYNHARGAGNSATNPSEDGFRVLISPAKSMGTYRGQKCAIAPRKLQFSMHALPP